MGPLLQHFQIPDTKLKSVIGHSSNRPENDKIESKTLCFGLERRASTFQGIPIIPEMSLHLHHNIPPSRYGKYAEMMHAEMHNLHVTMKRVHPKSSIDYQSIIIREIEVLSEVRHPNILLLMGVVNMDFYRVVTVFEDASFGSLYQLLHEQDVIIPLHITTNLVIQLCQVMIFLHDKGWLHTAITSHAILLARHNTLKLAGFELAQNIYKTPPATQNELSLRNQWYNWQAPEQLRRPQDARKESDVFSAGLVCWEMCTNDIPWTGYSREEIMVQYSQSRGCALRVEGTSLPSPLSAILRQALQVEPHSRRISFLTILNLLKGMQCASSYSDSNQSSFPEICSRWSPDTSLKRLRFPVWPTQSLNTTSGGTHTPILSPNISRRGFVSSSQSPTISSRSTFNPTSLTHSPSVFPRRWPMASRSLGRPCSQGALKKTRLVLRPQLQRTGSEPEPDPDPDRDPYTGLRRVRSFRRPTDVDSPSNLFKEKALRHLTRVPTSNAIIAKEPLAKEKSETDPSSTNSSTREGDIKKPAVPPFSVLSQRSSDELLNNSWRCKLTGNLKMALSQQDTQSKGTEKVMLRNDTSSFSQHSFNSNLELTSKPSGLPAKPYKPTAIKPASHQNQRALACTKVRPVVIPPLIMSPSSEHDLQTSSTCHSQTRRTTRKEQIHSRLHGRTSLQISAEEETREKQPYVSFRSTRETIVKSPIRCPRTTLTRHIYQNGTFHELREKTPVRSEKMHKQGMPSPTEDDVNKISSSSLISKIEAVQASNKDHVSVLGCQMKSTGPQDKLSLSIPKSEKEDQTELHHINNNSSNKFDKNNKSRVEDALSFEMHEDAKSLVQKQKSLLPTHLNGSMESIQEILDTNSPEDLYIDDEFDFGMGLDSHMQLLSVQDYSLQYRVNPEEDIMQDQVGSELFPSTNVLENIRIDENQHNHSHSSQEVDYPDKLPIQTECRLVQVDNSQTNDKNVLDLGNMKWSECRNITFIPYCVGCQKQQLLEAISMQKMNTKYLLECTEHNSQHCVEYYDSNKDPLLEIISQKPKYIKGCELFSTEYLNDSKSGEEVTKLYKITNDEVETKENKLVDCEESNCNETKRVNGVEHQIAPGTDFWNLPFDAD